MNFPDSHFTPDSVARNVASSMWMRRYRFIDDLRQLFGLKPTRRNRARKASATELLEPKALLSFSAGNVLVFRVSNVDGANKPNAVSLVQYPPSAGASPVNITNVQSNGSVGTLTDVPTDTSTGFLNISGDGQYITLMGTEAATGAANINNSFRSVLRYDYNASGRQIARLNSGNGLGYSGPKAPNGATTFGGDSNAAATFWTASPSTANAPGVRFFEYSGTGTYTTPTPVQLTATTVLNVSAFGNVLFASTSGSVLYFPDPRNSAVAPVALSGTAIASSSGSFFLLDRSPTVGMNALNGLDTLYVVDGANIEKYEYTGNGTTNVWTARGIAAFSSNLFALSGRPSGDGVSLVATTAVADNNSVVTISDTSAFGGNLTGSAASFTTLYSAGAAFRFKGVQFAPTILNVAPTDITLSSASIAENLASGSTVGTLAAVDATPEDTHTFSLVTGTGSTDNANFTIVGNQLRSAAAFDFETKSSYSIRVRATDAGGLQFEKVFTISVTNVNEAPTNITLSNASLAENQPSGTAIGNFTATDPDAGDTHTWALVAGTGSTDNASFTIVGNQLRSAAAFDFETKSSYSIRVCAKDALGLTFEKVFTISISNATELSTIDVQLGQTQRSFVRYLDMTFDRSEDIQSLLTSASRFRLRRSGLLDGVNFVAHTAPSFLMSAVGPRTIRIDFSAQGIGGNRSSNVGDGYYELGFDTDGDGVFTSAFDGKKRFYRLLGDVTGDGKVTTADDTAIYSALGTTNPERDANGDGVVNSNDRTLTQRAFGRKLLDSLFSSGLDD